MAKPLFLLPVLAVLLLLTGCMAYRDDRTSYLWRSEHFQQLLADPVAVSAFTKGDTNAVASFIQRRLASDPAFAKAYQAVLTEEGIRFFTPAQVSQYFYVSIHQRIH